MQEEFEKLRRLGKSGFLQKKTNSSSEYEVHKTQGFFASLPLYKNRVKLVSAEGESVQHWFFASQFVLQSFKGEIFQPQNFKQDVIRCLLNTKQ